MNILCRSCGVPIDHLSILLEGEKLFGDGSATNEGDCFECYFIKNPIGSEPEWCKELELLGYLDFMN